jgi:hypothetical protein
MPDALDAILPLSITNTAKRSGNEWVLPLREAKQAIELASDNGVAILGVESFRIEDGGFRVENYTGYGFDFAGDWPDEGQTLKPFGVSSASCSSLIDSVTGRSF